MPVISPISKAVKTGLKFTPAASGTTVSTITTSSQAAMCGPAFLPSAPVPIPVLPVGQVASIALVKIEALLFKSHEISSQIANKMITQYNQDKAQANAQREIALEQLYNDEKAAQDEIKEEVTILEEEIATLEEEIPALEAEQDSEREAYLAQVFEYKENAKNADAQGKTEERDMWIAKVDDLDPWLAEIILMVIEITNKKIEKMSKENELEDKQFLANLSLRRDWDFLEQYATDFEVVVPYYPDLPSPPALPPAVPQPNESFMPKALRQQFAKWLVAPMVPPIGLTVSAIQIMIQSFAPSAPPQAAQAEADADAKILQLGGCI